MINLLTGFAELVKSRVGLANSKLVVAAAHDRDTLEAVYGAADFFGLGYLLVGDGEKIKRFSDEMGRSPDGGSIVHSLDDESTAKTSVSIIKDMTNGVLVKGMIETSTLLRAVVNKESGIRAEKTMSHVAFLELPSYHKLFAVTDGGMCQNPTLEQKADIVKNAVRMYRSIAGKGYEPKIAALSASETVNPKLEESVHCAELKKMAGDGEFGRVVFEGPISFDLAASKKAAHKKGYDSPVCGDADIFLVPNITTGNVFCKCLIEWAGAKMAGAILGAAAPIVLVSRAASAEEKLNSVALCIR